MVYALSSILGLISLAYLKYSAKLLLSYDVFKRLSDQKPSFAAAKIEHSDFN